MRTQLDAALADLAKGKPIVVAGQTGGDLVCAAEFSTPALVAFLVRRTSGYLCVALTESDADRLALPPIVSGEPHAVSVDARHTKGTGISAQDRARTARLLASPCTVAADLSRPGHVVPMRARTGGMLQRAGRTEAAVDLVRLAGLRPAALLGAVVSEHNPVEMAGPDELAEFAARYGLCVIDLEELMRFLRSRCIERVADKMVRLGDGLFRSTRYRDADGLDHLALTLGHIDGEKDVLVGVHAECLDGDVFGSLDCDCRARLRESIVEIIDHQRGILVYVREGVADSAAVTAGMLREQGVRSVRLLGADFSDALRAHGVAVTASVPEHQMSRLDATGAAAEGDTVDCGRRLWSSGYPRWDTTFRDVSA